jgi:hypothetical protein
MVIHQGVINSHDTMFPQIIIIAFHGSHIMSIAKAFKKIMEDVGTGGDDHIDHFHLNHITDYPAHPAWNHRAGQPDEDNAGRIIEHFSKNVITLEDISTLKGGVLEGLNQIKKAFYPSEI